MSFVDELRKKVSESQTKLTDAKEAVVIAEQELTAWKGILGLAEAQNDPRIFEKVVLDILSSFGHKVTAIPTPTFIAGADLVFTAEEAKSKEKLVLAALKRARRAVRPREIVELMKPLVSRSMVYKALSDLEAAKKVVTLDGEVFLTGEGYNADLIEEEGK